MKGDRPNLHHIDRYVYKLHLLVYTQAIALGDTFRRMVGVPGFGHETEDHVRLWQMVTWVISFSENG